MPYANLLHVYDADDSLIRNTAPHRSAHESDMKELPVSGGVKGLRRELDALVQGKWTFARAIFSTHGNSGYIFFGNEKGNKGINAGVLENQFKHRGYERLFPVPQTRMYFGGCNVAEGTEGWMFLGTAASIFFKSMGGVAFGQTSKGFAMHPITMFASSPLVFAYTRGKILHPWGESKYVVVGPGGHFVKTETADIY